MPSPIEVIINAGSGSVEQEETKRRLLELFKDNGVEANVSMAGEGEDIIQLARKAANGNCSTIVAGGGDGTVSAGGQEVIKTGKTLGILPLGTLNNFSKDLGIPQDLAEAVHVITQAKTKEIDVGEVNGRLFVNNSSIGLYPGIVRRREKRQRLGYGKWRSAIWAGWKMLMRSPFFAVRLETEKGSRIVKTPFVFVGNNQYEMDFFNIGRRARMDDGRLSVYFLHRSGRKGLLMLVVRTIFGRLRQTDDFEELNTPEITIETKKKHILVAFDGEVEKLETPLRYKIHKHALRVIVPPEAGEE